MKIRERALAILLSMVMMLTFMPALAFAEGEEPDADGTPAVEEAVVDEAPAAEEAKEESAITHDKHDSEPSDDPVMETLEASWSADFEYDYIVLEGSTQTLKVEITGTEPEGGLFYEWYYSPDDIDMNYTIIPGANTSSLTVNQPGYYNCYIYDSEDNERDLYAEVYDHDDWFTVYIGGLAYELNTYNDKDGAGVWGSQGPVSGNVGVLSAVTLSNGRSYPVTTIDLNVAGAASITIPASVTNIDLQDIPAGFTIFGTFGSAAQTYAAQKGILFRDPAAEAEAARQGTFDGSLPKVKIAKPKAAKKAATVKWKKLNKKQLKKAQKIEIWVCPNGGFGPNDTIMKTAGKKKASLKVKGLKKGTYYVKVRAIKYVGGTKMVGPWSKVKKVKIKK